MTPFLKQVAQHYLAGEADISKTIFVLPSQRAVVFFRKYIAEAVRESCHAPVLLPRIMSIDDFFGQLGGIQTSDPLTLVVELYESYKLLCDKNKLLCESLDNFLFWGNVILADFDDVDKYLADAQDLFRNVSDLKNLEDDFSYLSPEQAEALRAFLGRFKVGGEIKENFARLWNLLGPLYKEFNERLDISGHSYTGRELRSIVGRIQKQGVHELFRQAFPESEKVVFAGLNALCECEKKILGKLRDESLAEFSWDYCSDWIKNSHNKSSYFMKDIVREFHTGNDFIPEYCSDKPSFEVIRVPSGVGQAKLMSQILSQKDFPADERTAIVLPDETLLQPLLNSIPQNVQKVNVTMGYGMACSSFFTLLCDIALLQQRIRFKDGKAAFYHKPVWSIFTNNIFSALADEATLAVVARVKEEKRFYVDADKLTGSPLLELLFRPVVTDLKSAEASQTDAVGGYILGILDFVGRALASDETKKLAFPLELDFAMECVKTINLLVDKHLAVLPATWFSLMESVLRGKSIPLKGEPLSGLQIMGPLETRALDFDRVYILSSNEGVFPRSNISASFIPPLLRKGFGLPTYEYQDAVWAYYFYRLIQRPSYVGMVLDTRTDGMRSGEESRYIKQLKYHFQADVKESVAMSVPEFVQETLQVDKTQEHIDFIHGKNLSATALQNYLSCSMKFYYSFILGLSDEDEVVETMDSGVIGNVYHNVMQQLYEGRPQNKVTAEYINDVLKDADGLFDMVGREICAQMNTDSITGRDIVTQRIIYKYIRRTLQTDLEFLRRDNVDYFTVKLLEKNLYCNFGGFAFKGRVDRMDSFVPGITRVVDYKTGKVLDDDVNIDSSNAEAVADKVFGPDNAKRPKIALQFFIYDMLLDAYPQYASDTIVNTVYSTRTLMHDTPENVYKNDAFYNAMKERLAVLLQEIDNPGVPFTCHEPSGFGDTTCEFCDFKMICGR